ncbi:MAG: endolytic transglycosylase MltG [Clostridia bacterium]|nr:endolytic transglycosylase MltG [Clostridia bacterium]
MKKNTIKFILISLLIAAVLVAGYIFSLSINGLFVKPVEKEFTVPEGMGAYAVVDMLKEEGLIKSELFMKIEIKRTGSAGKIRSGSSNLSSKMSYSEILKNLKNAKSILKVTIPEGFELDGIVELLSKSTGIPKGEFWDELEMGRFDYWFVNEDLPFGKYRLEGYIFPETYFFDKSMTAHQIIDMCLAQFDKVFTPEMKAKTLEMGYSVHEIVTLASIIEKEGSSELDKISSVFHNRLKSSDFSKLESCATVIYVTKQPKDRLNYTDISIESPYNTYLNDGLPPGPIASPGKNALVAAVNPADTDYFYFSATGDGKNTFSKTYEEHLSKQE